MVFFLALEPWAPETSSAPCHVAAGGTGPIGHQGAGNSSLKPGDGQQTTLGCLSSLHCAILGPSHHNKMKISGLYGTEMGQMVFTHPLSAVLHSLLPGMPSNILSCLAWRRDSSIVWQVLGQTLALLLQWAVGEEGAARGQGHPALSLVPSGSFQAAPQANVVRPCEWTFIQVLHTGCMHKVNTWLLPSTAP